MRLRRKTLPRSPRQKLRSDSLAKPPSAFAYRARRLEAERNTGRQAPSESSGPKLPSRRASFHRLWLQRTGLIILVLAVVASAINILSLSNEAKLVPLTTTSSRTLLHPTTDYETAANRQLSNSIWNRNKVTVDTSGLSRQMLSQFPELSSVTVTV